MTYAASELELHARENFLPSEALLQERMQLERALERVRNAIEAETNLHLRDAGIISTEELAERDIDRKFPLTGKTPQEVPEEMFA